MVYGQVSLPKMTTDGASDIYFIIGLPVYHAAMRNFGAVLLLVGLLGFFYASSQAVKYEPAPAGASLSEELETPAGRWEIARYASAGAAALGLLMALFPKGR